MLSRIGFVYYRSCSPSTIVLPEYEFEHLTNILVVSIPVIRCRIVALRVLALILPWFVTLRIFCALRITLGSEEYGSCFQV